MPASSSSLRAAAAAVPLLLSGACEGPWEGLPSGSARDPRASVAIFLQDGAPSTATFSRPVDLVDAHLGSPDWIDTARSFVEIASSSAGAQALRWDPPDLGSPWVQWDRSMAAVAASPALWRGSERVRCRLRWNASCPWSSAAPYATDSFDVPVETSSAPRLRRTALASIDLLWPALAHLDPRSRRHWAASPDSLFAGVRGWDSLRAARGLDARVLAYDAGTGTIRRFVLDTALLASGLRSPSGFPIWDPVVAGDTLVLAAGNRSSLLVTVDSSNADPFHVATATSADLASATVARWKALSDKIWLREHDQESSDQFQVDVGGPDTAESAESDRIRIAVAGTCAGQRAWLAGGGSTRGEHPRGNVAPLDGFACRVRIDTLSFHRLR